MSAFQSITCLRNTLQYNARQTSVTLGAADGYNNRSIPFLNSTFGRNPSGKQICSEEFICRLTVNIVMPNSLQAQASTPDRKDTRLVSVVLMMKSKAIVWSLNS